ncbi:MAG: type II toxin-antitoxin system RelE/ParE family toxin [Rickettsiales bacterium]
MAPQAREDLENIYLEIAKDNPQAAVAFMQNLTEQIAELAFLGVDGSPRGWISKGLRAFPYRERCFYFRIDGNNFFLLRVLHGKQDIPNQFSED